MKESNLLYLLQLLSETFLYDFKYNNLPPLLLLKLNKVIIYYTHTGRGGNSRRDVFIGSILNRVPQRIRS